MSEDKLNQAARKAYADAQKESDAAREREEKTAKSPDTPKESDKAVMAESEPAQKENSKETPSEATEKTDSKGESKPSGDKESQDNLEGELASAQEKPISDLNEELAKIKDELARAHADLYNLQQEYNAYARRTKAEVPLQQEAGVASVVNALMGVLDDVELARVHGDLEGSFGAVATKLEQTLETNFKVKRYGAKGDSFDPNLHQAIQMLDDATGDDHVIDQVAQPGYLIGERVLRPAMVIVRSATASSNGDKDNKSEKSNSGKDSSKHDEVASQ